MDFWETSSQSEAANKVVNTDGISEDDGAVVESVTEEGLTEKPAPAADKLSTDSDSDSLVGVPALRRRSNRRKKKPQRKTRSHTAAADSSSDGTAEDEGRQSDKEDKLRQPGEEWLSGEVMNGCVVR